MPDGFVTTGSFETEAEAVSALVAALGDRWFFVYREVAGHYLFSRPFTEERQPRADLIIRPKRTAIETSGWTEGVIGVECKRSGVKIGPMINQVLDYQDAAFYPSESSGTGIIPKWWAIWPVGRVTGPTESILAQRRILTADLAKLRGGPAVCFKQGSRNVLHVSAESLVTGTIVSGSKRGSR